jgi:beta-galactosidase
MPFLSGDAALRDAVAGPEFRRFDANPLALSLDGTWRFSLSPNPLADLNGGGPEAPPDWVSPSFGAKDWADITVPGTWTRQGWDKPHYTNVQMPFQAMPPRAPADNPTGLYRRTFALPEAWRRKRVVLHIGSAESCCLVYVNGRFAGAGKDTRLPSEYDITPYLAPETEQTLCLKIIRYSDASYIEDQDQWWFGGPHRSAYLYATEDCYIQDVEVLPGTVSGGTGRLSLSVVLGGNLPKSTSFGDFRVKSSGGEPPFTLAYSLYPFTLPASAEDAERIAAETQALLSDEHTFEPDYRLNANRFETSLTLDAPALWSSENPNLYVLRVSLLRENRHIESAAFLTGFRNIAAEDRELRINGKAVLIKGVNRHEHDEKTGKTLSVEGMMRDIKLLKTHNFNAVRTCHYPDDERWYDLCDRYGIYLLDEANVEHHCFYHQLCRDSAWTYAYASRIQRMVERDKNHPSVIIWSLGNECGCGPNHAMMSAWVHSADPTRPVNYEGACQIPGGGGYSLDSLSQGRNITDIVGPMYPAISLITDFAKYRQDDRPLIMVEYSHAMGNSNGSLADYWEAIETHRGLQGGFIWDWIDQGLEAFSDTGVKYWKYGGDFGDSPSDYDFCLNGLLFPDQTPKPAMAECKQVFAPIRLTPLPAGPYTFLLENRFDFSGLDHIELRWELRSETEVLACGVEALPSLAPGASAEITLPIPEVPPTPETRYIHADFRLKKPAPWADAGFTICSAERLLRDFFSPFFLHKFSGVPQVSAQERADFATLFKPSLFRVPTENDGIKLYSHLRGDPAAAFYYRNKALYPWLDLDLLHLRLLDERTDEVFWMGCPAQKRTATLVAGGAAAPEYKNKRLGTYACITALPDNAVILDIAFDLDPSLPELPRVGVTAEIPAHYRNIRWFGAGPHESYPDRKASAFLGLWEDTPESLETPYIVPQENGNRTGVRSVTLRSDSGKSVTIRAEKPLNMSVSRYAQENMLAARHTIDLEDTRGYYQLNLDAAQRGVGTGACGPDTLEPYRVRPGLFSMRLSLFL